jgi:hypothetical protein
MKDKSSVAFVQDACIESFDFLLPNHPCEDHFDTLNHVSRDSKRAIVLSAPLSRDSTIPTPSPRLSHFSGPPPHCSTPTHKATNPPTLILLTMLILSTLPSCYTSHSIQTDPHLSKLTPSPRHPTNKRNIIFDTTTSSTISLHLSSRRTDKRICNSRHFEDIRARSID